MKILIVDCQDELLIASLFVHDDHSAKTVEKEWRRQEIARGHELERIMIRGGTLEIMERDQPIPSGKPFPISKAMSS